MRNNLSILALDLGSKYIGLAVSRKGSFLGSPLGALIRKTIEEDLEEISQILDENNIDLLLIGMPYVLNSKIESDQCLIVKDFVNCIKKIKPKLEIAYIDERLSSWAVKKQMGSKRLKRGRHKINLDSLAAASFIESYLSD